MIRCAPPNDVTSTGWQHSSRTIWLHFAVRGVAGNKQKALRNIYITGPRTEYGCSSLESYYVEQHLFNAKAKGEYSLTVNWHFMYHEWTTTQPFLQCSTLSCYQQQPWEPQGIRNGCGIGIISLTLTGSWHAPPKWIRPIFCSVTFPASCSHIFRASAPSHTLRFAVESNALRKGNLMLRFSFSVETV